MDKRYYEYVLKYPEGFIVDGADVSGVVFYVGKGTISPSWTNVERMDMHEVEARRGCDCLKCNAIRGIWDNGQQVDKEKVFESEHEYEVLAKEQTDIKETYAGKYLTNYQHNRPVKQPKPQESERDRMIRLRVQSIAAQVMKDELKRKRGLK
jgi:hypothetical protein